VIEAEQAQRDLRDEHDAADHSAEKKDIFHGDNALEACGGPGSDRTKFAEAMPVRQCAWYRRLRAGVSALDPAAHPRHFRSVPSAASQQQRSTRSCSPAGARRAVATCLTAEGQRAHGAAWPPAHYRYHAYSLSPLMLRPAGKQRFRAPVAGFHRHCLDERLFI
jgi:hypothetical protein